MRMIEWLKRLISSFLKKPKEEGVVAEVRRAPPPTPLYRPRPRRQPMKRRALRQRASQTYTIKKIRGLPPRSAYKKRMWKLGVTKKELEEL